VSELYLHAILNSDKLIRKI